MRAFFGAWTADAVQCLRAWLGCEGLGPADGAFDAPLVTVQMGLDLGGIVLVLGALQRGGTVHACEWGHAQIVAYKTLGGSHRGRVCAHSAFNAVGLCGCVAIGASFTVPARGTPFGWSVCPRRALYARASRLIPSIRAWNTDESIRRGQKASRT